MINEANLSAVYDQKVSGSKVAAPRTRKREQTERPIKGAEKHRAHTVLHVARGRDGREERREEGRGKSDGARESERAT